MRLLPEFATAPPGTWDAQEIERWKVPEDSAAAEGWLMKFSSYNPTPGVCVHTREMCMLACAHAWNACEHTSTRACVRTHTHTHAGSGHTGMHSIAPNNFPFYSESERYRPVIQSDGGQLSGARGKGKLACVEAAVDHQLTTNAVAAKYPLALYLCTSGGPRCASDLSGAAPTNR